MLSAMPEMHACTPLWLISWAMAGALRYSVATEGCWVIWVMMFGL